MYISDIPRQVRSEYDSSLELRAYSAAALSATGSSTAIPFVPKNRDFKVIVNHAAVSSYVATTAEWTVDVEISASSGSGFVSIGSATLTGTASIRELAFTGKQCEATLATAAYIRVTATKTGTPGALTFGAFISPI